MKISMVAWGIVLLVGFWLSDYALKTGITANYIWLAWAVIINAGNYAVGRTFKKTPKELNTVWLQAGIIGFVMTVLIVAGFLVVDVSILLSVWLMLMGAAYLAGGVHGKNPSGIFFGAYFVIFALMTPAFLFTFTAAAVIFGIAFIVDGYFMKN